MFKIIEKGDNVRFYCQGCDEMHEVPKDKWNYNGNPESPTLSPSLLLRTGHYVPGQPQPPNCNLCNYKDEDGEDWPWPCKVCHFFIRNGKMQYCNDCTHSLAGQTVDMKDIEDV